MGENSSTVQYIFAFLLVTGVFALCWSQEDRRDTVCYQGYEQMRSVGLSYVAHQSVSSTFPDSVSICIFDSESHFCTLVTAWHYHISAVLVSNWWFTGGRVGRGLKTEKFLHQTVLQWYYLAIILKWWGVRMSWTSPCWFDSWWGIQHLSKPA